MMIPAIEAAAFLVIALYAFVKAFRWMMDLSSVKPKERPQDEDRHIAEQMRRRATY